MSRHRRQGGRVTPKGTRPPSKSIGGYRERDRERPSSEPPFLHDARRVLRERSPFGLLSLASSIVEAATVRPVDLVRQTSGLHVTGPELYETFVESGLPETEALAQAVATLLPDELLARTLRKRIEARGSVLRDPPTWLESMDRIEVTDVAEMVHILDDGDNVMVAWRWPDGSAATAVVYIDHNMGTVVKDAWVMSEPLDVLVRHYERSGLKDQVIRPLDRATARVRITEAITAGQRVVPPLVTDTWPMCRPMVEWVVRALPEGGRGFVRPDWSMRQREDLLEDFVVLSPFARALGLPTSVVAELAEPLVWFGCETATGDPLRWSPVSVEIVLVDWYPRTVFDIDPLRINQVPDVVEAFVRFAHDRQMIPAYLTDETVEAVARWTPDFLEAMARQDPSGQYGDEGSVDSLTEEELLDELELQIIEQVGGRQAYATLNDDPLPDEPFDWSAIPEKWRDQTASTLARLDQMTTDLCDVETRTVGRRILATLASDGDVFKRSTDFDRLSAAIIWVMFRMWQVGGVALGFKFGTQKELGAAVSVKATLIGSTASTLGGRLYEPRFDWSTSLHSRRRRALLSSRKFIADARREIEPTP